MTRKAPSQASRGGAAEPLDHDKAGDHAITPGAAAAPPDGRTDEGRYEVGYGRPPLHSRFKRGKSGNPKGRPKQSGNLRTIVKQVSDEQIQIRDGDRLRRMPRIEALVRTTFARALKDPKALPSLIVLLRQCGYGADHNEPAGDVLLGPEYQTIIDDFLARQGIEKDTSDEDVQPVLSPAVKPAKPGS
jgi:hypothetical protein